MNYHDSIYPAVAEPGMIISIEKRDRSLDNGATWHVITHVYVMYSQDDIENAIETGKHNGPPMSGFWGNCNEIRSGYVDVSFRRWDGKRWRRIDPSIT